MPDPTPPAPRLTAEQEQRLRKMQTHPASMGVSENLTGPFPCHCAACEDSRAAQAALAELAALRAQVETLTTALETLVYEAEGVIEDTRGVMLMAHVHGTPYQGRTMHVKAAKEVLAALRQPTRPPTEGAEP